MLNICISYFAEINNIFINTTISSHKSLSIILETKFMYN